MQHDVSLYAGLLQRFEPILATLTMIRHPPAAMWRRCGGGASATIVTGAPVVRVVGGAHAEQLQLGGAGKGVFDGRVPDGVPKTRIDVWIAQQLPQASRARIQDSIRNGLAIVNGKPVSKSSHAVGSGDHVVCTLCRAVPLEAKPEDVQLDIVHEDQHVIVVNKSADMVVHPAPGHSSGTLVNAVLHHCGLSAVMFSSSRAGLLDPTESDEDGENVDEKEEDEEVGAGFTLFHGPDPVIRPGIVHRLDKGTSGLLVIAKDEYSHMHLSEQFKSRKVRRSYLSLTCGTPSTMSGRVEAPIIRDPRDRKRMAVAENVSQSAKVRYAASRYRVLEELAQGGSALVEWRLETGRTHQIRVHARHLGHPVLGDEIYGGTQGLATCKLLSCLPSSSRQSIEELVSDVHRPCLHAYTLGFVHPWTKKEVQFSCLPPPDFESVWRRLREMKDAK